MLLSMKAKTTQFCWINSVMDRLSKSGYTLRTH